jgi:annexin A7/11
MKGFGTNEKALTQVLSKQDPIQMNTIREQYQRRYHQDLVEHLKKETSGNFEDLLVALARGPLINDCWALKEAMKGVGTKEDMLNDILVGRSNADLNAIKTEYQKIFRTSLEADLRSDLSQTTEQLFIMIVAARRNEDSVHFDMTRIEQDTKALQKACGNIVTKDPVAASQILTSQNDAQIRAIAERYQANFQESLVKALKKSFSGHMRDALVLFITRAQNKALSDAEQLEDSMAGVGTKNTYLIQRVVRAHWNKQHMQQVKVEYQKKYKKDLKRRIEGETSGDYERLLVACIE